MLTDLVDRGRLEISDDKRPKVCLLDDAPTGNPFLDEVLNRIVSAGRERWLSTWIERITLLTRLRERASASLVERGVLEMRTHKVLGLFPTKRFPEADPLPETQVVERLRAAIFEPDSSIDDIDDRTCLLVGIAHPTGLLDVAFGRRDVEQHADRIAQLIQDDRIGEATRRAVRAAELTVAAGMTAAATTAANVANS